MCGQGRIQPLGLGGNFCGKKVPHFFLIGFGLVTLFWYSRLKNNKNHLFSEKVAFFIFSVKNTFSREKRID